MRWCRAVLVLAAGAASACSSPVADAPRRLRLLTASPFLEVRHCVDATGHRPGKLPFVFDGECCCTPHSELMAEWHAAGLPAHVTLAAVRQRYRELGIVTAEEHDGCNNLCENGPHVVFGGRCMASPTPATLNYEMVISGWHGTPGS